MKKTKDQIIRELRRELRDLRQQRTVALTRFYSSGYNTGRADAMNKIREALGLVPWTGKEWDDGLSKHADPLNPRPQHGEGASRDV